MTTITVVKPGRARKNQKIYQLEAGCNAAFKEMEKLFAVGPKAIAELNKAVAKYHRLVGEFVKITGMTP